ncbi:MULTISPECIES: ATP cone domain-containing protein [Peptoniphilaceae]|uniref:ATP cone domain-containing protein n=1 Tax=Peptoniphilaceae TaxID=1570339 RepID=UPI000B918209|nr:MULTISPECIES: ATP cone domain-containing protein [Peptoniphilaceae]MDU2099249.1 ATP cone domain-containing protein [Staphylococcus sp.]MDU2131577.1 ATP cone domain-containing protein [Finegoldia magna]MDU2220201.1 ATP cone domain-containing protein [Finegoldia magna]MDU4278227.1 ATP cone domain-containing protein [Finegoldia magna]MDU6552692.1 ATP cone domain-containing protein [Finegoldia magna]
MNDLTKILFDYFKDNDIDPNKVANLIEDAKINVLDEMFGEEGEWVLKKLGSVESFDKEKIFHSIAQTSDSAGAKMNTSDVNIIVEDVLKKMKSIKRNVYPTKEIRGYVEEALREEGYKKVLEEYQDN